MCPPTTTRDGAPGNSSHVIPRHDVDAWKFVGGSRQLQERADATLEPRLRILFVDADDSFSHNIMSLLRKCLARNSVENQIDFVKIYDENLNSLSPQALHRRLKECYDGMIVGPGPGHPAKEKDVGFVRHLWTAAPEHVLPILGVCLGFQSMCLSAGAAIVKLREVRDGSVKGAVRHGVVREVVHSGQSVFSDCKHITATHYHSLHAQIHHPLQSDRAAVTATEDMWKSSEICPLIEPLAWDCSDKTNGTILMAARVRDKPFWGVQFHPESICTNAEAHKLFDNWLKEVAHFRKKQERGEAVLSSKHDVAKDPTGTGLEETWPERYPNGLLENNRRTHGPKHDDTTNFEEGDTSKSSRKRSASRELSEEAECSKKPRRAQSEMPRTDDEVEQREPDVYDSDRESTESEQMDASNHGEIGTVPLEFGGFDFSKVVHVERFHLAPDDRPHIVPFLVKHLGMNKGEATVLQSGNRANGQQVADDRKSRYSILAMVDEDQAIKLMYFDLQQRIVLAQGSDCRIVQERSGSAADYWARLNKFNTHLKVPSEGQGNLDDEDIEDNEERPFWGGFFAMATYEACLESIDVNRKEQAQESHPDIVAVLIRRSVVIDHSYNTLFVQSIAPNDHPFVYDTAAILYDELKDRRRKLEGRTTNSAVFDGLESFDESEVDGAIRSLKPTVVSPRRERYIQKVSQCQQHEHGGDSYELCLTDQTTVTAPQLGKYSDWNRFQELQRRNPAPFGAYVRMRVGTTAVTIIGSSPERFCSWNRGGSCQFEPIKGTMRRTSGSSRALAEYFFRSSEKERAELRMIIDLTLNDIRDVLQGTAGEETVRVSKLFHVEEYETVYQQLSVIKANLAGTGKTGIDLLSKCLPPGSMTGAPKKRSCQLLQAIEERDRGFYSGVLGYIDVGGGGDFSVVIRSAVKWDDETKATYFKNDRSFNLEQWHIGAGGAVTAQSTPEDEYEEMDMKLNAVLSAFSERN